MDMKNCAKCKIEKNTSEFYKDKNMKFGVGSRCKDCINAQNKSSDKSSRRKEANEKFKQENPDYHADYNLKWNYGITLAQKIQMFDDQNGSCANQECPTVFEDVSKAHVDHNHKTGEVRKLLCQHCNQALGHLRENARTIHGLGKYIEDYNV